MNQLPKTYELLSGEAEVLGLPEHLPGGLLPAHITTALATEDWCRLQLAGVENSAFPAGEQQELYGLYRQHFLASNAAGKMLKAAGMSCHRERMAGVEITQP